MTKEIWQSVPKFEGLYQVSNLGRVRSLSRTRKVRNRWGPMLRCFPGRILKDYVGPFGYRGLSFSNEKKKYYVFVHHLVAAAFIGPRPRGFHVCHKDGVKINCQAENLYYGTPQQNSNDSIKHGHQVRGERVAASKLTENEVRAIRKLNGVMQQRVIAKKFGVCQSTVGFIIRREFWKHVK